MEDIERQRSSPDDFTKMLSDNVSAIWDSVITLAQWAKIPKDIVDAMTAALQKASDKASSEKEEVQRLGASIYIASRTIRELGAVTDARTIESVRRMYGMVFPFSKIGSNAWEEAKHDANTRLNTPR